MNIKKADKIINCIYIYNHITSNKTHWKDANKILKYVVWFFDEFKNKYIYMILIYLHNMYKLQKIKLDINTYKQKSACSSTG